MPPSADQLDLRPPGSILDWRIFDDGFAAGDYRIVHLGPRQWAVSHGSRVVGVYRRLRTAFVSAERHRRQEIRFSHVWATVVTVAAAALTWLLVDELVGWENPVPYLLIVFPAVVIALSAVAHLAGRMAGNPSSAYLPTVPVAVRRAIDSKQRRRSFFEA